MAKRLGELGFPVLPQLRLGPDDFPGGDPGAAAEAWAERLNEAGLAEAEAALDVALEAQDAAAVPMYSSPFAKAGEGDDEGAALPGESFLRHPLWPPRLHWADCSCKEIQ